MAIDPLIPTDPNLGKATGPAGPEKAGGADFLFHLIDLINPLQHIPVVSTIYRQITGDEIAPAARLIGAGLFTGPIGIVAATADIVAGGITGRDFGERATALLSGHRDKPSLPDTAQPLTANAPAAATHEPLAGENAITDPPSTTPPPADSLVTTLAGQTSPEPSVLAAELAARSGLADTILGALDKYQAMARERNELAARIDEDDDDKVSEDQR